MRHTPVLLKEVINILAPKAGEAVLDVTLGLGGHAKTFLEIIGATGRLAGLDLDEDNLSSAKRNLSSFDNIEYFHLNFGEIGNLDLGNFDVIFADLGLSSPQLDNPQRGFSFRSDAPLDMRFDRSGGIGAAELISSLDERRLSDIFWKYGEIGISRRLAGAIKNFGKIKTTFELKSCVEKAAGFRAKYILPQVFQALRIAVNDELSSLVAFLDKGPALLKKGGRMGVISFHSLEDRMVKLSFRKLTAPRVCPATGAIIGEPQFSLLTKKPIVPSSEEISANPRSRSAKFRGIEKLSAVAQ